MGHRIKLIDIELSKPIETIENLEGYTALKGLVRLHGEPLGFVQLGITNGYCAANAISKAILDHHSWGIISHLMSDGLTAQPNSDGLCIEDLVKIEHPVYTGPEPLVTVAVCTRDRTDDLVLCLDALHKLEYPNLEIMVVDNAPASDATERLLRSSYPKFRYIREHRPGKSWALNQAIIQAKGEIIAFVDDDVVVDSKWVSAFAPVFAENPEVMALTGLVIPYELETMPQLFFEWRGGFCRGFKRQWIRIQKKKKRKARYHHGSGNFGTGANVAFRRDIFDKIGYFDPALGPGSFSKSGEDLDMFFRVLQEGYTMVYEPNALVRHRHRREYSELKEQMYEYGIALSAYHMKSILAHRKERIAFIRLVIWWFLRQIKLLLRSFTRPTRYPRDLITTEILGNIVGFISYFKARRNARNVVSVYGPQERGEPSNSKASLGQAKERLFDTILLASDCKDQ